VSDLSDGLKEVQPMPHVDEASSSGRLTPRKLRHAYGRQCVEPGVDIRMSRSSAPVGSPSYFGSPGAR